MPNQNPQRRRTDPQMRVHDAVTLADVGDLAEHIPLSQMDREQFPRWIQALTDAEANARRLREQLEELLAESSRR
jgi:hypothetical protein